MSKHVAPLTVTYSNQLVLGASSQVLAIRTEAHASDVQVAGDIHAVVLQHAQFLARLDIVDLGRSVATSSDVFPVGTEPHAADHTLMLQGVDQVDVKHSGNRLVENDEPVIPRLLGMGRHAVGVQIAQGVVGGRRGRMVLLHGPRMVRGRMGGYLRGLARPGIRHRCVDLGGRGTASRRSAYASSSLGTRGRSALRGLGWKSSRAGRPWGVLLLVRRLLGRRRRRGRRTLHARRWLRHRVLRGLLLLRRWRGWGSKTAALSAVSGHDCSKVSVVHADGGRLGGVGATHGARRSAAGVLKLAAQMGNFFFVPGLQAVSPRSTAAKTHVLGRETYFCFSVK